MGIKGFRLDEVNNMKFEKQGIPHNAGITISKAKTILKEGQIGGKDLTSKQKGFFGLKLSDQKQKEGGKKS